MSESLLASFGSANAEHVQSMLATPEGLKLLADPIIPTLTSGEFEGDELPRLIDFIQAFVDNPDDPAQAFSAYPTIEGNQSQLYDIGLRPGIGSLILKVSTPQTKFGRRGGRGRRYGPENLPLHVKFLNSLRYHPALQEGANISVPEHYFAMRLDTKKHARHSLTIMQRVPDVTNVDLWTSDREGEGMPLDTKRETLQLIAARIENAVATDSAYRQAIGDLFYDEELDLKRGRRPDHIIRGENVLIPYDTTLADIKDARLWLIDLPPPFGGYGKLARLALKNADYYPHKYTTWTRSRARKAT